MPFELYTLKGGRRFNPTATITSAGYISFSKSCFDSYLGDKKFAQLFFDKDKYLIGIKSSDKEEESSFKITRSGNNDGKKYSGSIAARSFLKNLGIDYSKSRRFIPEWYEKERMLVLKISNNK